MTHDTGDLAPDGQPPRGHQPLGSGFTFQDQGSLMSGTVGKLPSCFITLLFYLENVDGSGPQNFPNQIMNNLKCILGS